MGDTAQVEHYYLPTSMLLNTCPVLLTIRSLLLFPSVPFCDYKSISEAPAVCIQGIFCLHTSLWLLSKIHWLSFMN